jgi:uncharacterized damage-inducible protein DinB
MLTKLAEHNRWANQKIFAACAQVAPEKLVDPGDGYDSVLGILNHLVQVENAFLELAHERTPRWAPLDDLDTLKAECARIDQAYIDYASSIDSTDAESKRFLVPWFGFEITAVDGLIQPLTHSHKHRADVSMLLPHLGGEGVEMDFIQWLDEVRDRR